MISWSFLTTQLVYIFYILMIFSSLSIVSLNNPVQSILYLILVFIITSFLFILYNFTFLGLILMIVYLGAVVVLFLFIVMLLNIKVLELKRIINFYPFLFLLISFFFFFLLVNNFELNLIFKEKVQYFYVISDLKWEEFFFIKSSFILISYVLYMHFFFQFLLGGLVLFLAMVGAIVLTLTQLKFTKKQTAYLQLIRDRSTIFFSK